MSNPIEVQKQLIDKLYRLVWQSTTSVEQYLVMPACSAAKLKATLPSSVRRQGSTGEFRLDPVRNAIIAQGELRPIVHVEGR